MQKYFDINEQGYSVRCKLYCEDAAAVKRVIVCCHGFASSKESASYETFATRAVAKRKGTAVIAFDWPCHGEDARKNLLLSECETYLSLVVEYARVRFDTQELYAYGVSFGGYLLLKYLVEVGSPFRKVALRCPAIHMRQTLEEAILSDEDLRKLQAGKAILVGFERKVKITREFLDALEAADVASWPYFDFADDLLIVQGTADELVSFASVEAFADDNVIELFAVAGADHRFHDPRKMDAAIARIIDFFEL